MLANRMTDDSSENKEPKNNQSSEPHIVVACPSCKTKFAVESSLIAAYETPKFHCSRCDAVFERNETPRAPRHPQNIHSSKDLDELDSGQKYKPTTENSDRQRWILSENSDRSNSNPFSQAPSKHPALKSSDFTLGEAVSKETLEPRKHFAPLEERAGLSLLGLRQSAGRSLASSITRQESISGAAKNVEKRTDENTKEISQDGEIEENILDPFSIFGDPSPTPTPIQNVITSQAKQQTEQASENNGADSNNQHPQKKEKLNSPQVQSEESLTISHSRFRELTGVISSRLSPHNRGLLRLSTPVVITFGFFYLLGYCSQFAPKSVDSILKTVVPSFLTGKIAVLPDTDLRIQGVTLEFEKTQSKEVLPVVRGVIYNSGDTSTQDVLIEAIGFNSRGEVVTRAKAPLRSALAREKISDLPLATVKKFQTSLSARNSNINAGEKVAFSVALLSDSFAREDLAFYSARIFSVGSSRR